MFENTPIGWPERLLVGVFAILLLLVILAFGVLALGLALAAGLGLAARLWWLRQRLRREGVGASESRVIEGEYRVVERRSPSPGSSSGG